MRQSKAKNDNVKVVVRVRPPLARELGGGLFLSTVEVDETKTKLQLFEFYNHENLAPQDFEHYMENPNNFSRHNFNFDQVYDDESAQEQVYENTARLSVCSALEGYNATIMAYGQTGTGKTYTMEGMRYNLKDDQRGIIPRAVEDIFKYISNCDDEDTTFMVRASYIQIYNEVISDLLRSERSNLQIREDAKKGVYVEDVSEWVIVKPQEVLDLMKIGGKSRATAKTNMNQSSSRSHAVFVITIEQIRKEREEGQECKVAKLNLVDLAGSERVRVTGASGKRLEECKKINLSLSCLGMVIAALTENKSTDFIPYRNSVLTRMLSDSLGGNCKTTMVTMISPALEAFQESLSSLKFASRARNIRNSPTINEDLDQKALIRKYETQLKRLRYELEDKNKTIIDKTRLMQLEEEKRKVEEDKNTVMKALQQRSKEFFKEREEKKKLEEKIKAFNSQLIHGGGNANELEKAFNEQKRLIRQYESKLKNLEQEKKGGPDLDLFEKQNEILFRLTAKINERDEVNCRLNEELCAYDRIAKESEELIDRKNHRIEVLEELLHKNGIPMPVDVDVDSQSQMSKKKTLKEDGVVYDGRMIYNVSEGNVQPPSHQIRELTQINQKGKEEILRLRNRLESYENSSPNSNSSHSHKRHSKQMSEEDLLQQLEQYKVNQDQLLRELSEKSSRLESLSDSQRQFMRPFKTGLQTIVKGLTKKENTDMKVVINEIFKLQKLVSGC